jgi:hypothetical protein
MNQLNTLLKDVDREQIVRGTAIYMLVYSLLNICGGVLFGVVGAMTAGIGAIGAATSNEFGSAGSQELAQASSAAVLGGGLLVVLGIISVISFPFLLAAAIGLFQKKSWARMATVIALGLSILLSLVMTGSSGFLSSFFWIIVSGFGIYFFMTDEGIKSILSR